MIIDINTEEFEGLTCDAVRWMGQLEWEVEVQYQLGGDTHITTGVLTTVTNGRNDLFARLTRENAHGLNQHLDIPVDRILQIKLL